MCDCSHLPSGLQGSQCHLVGPGGQRPKGSWQIIQSVCQSAVHINVEARCAALKASGMQHHMVVPPVCQGRVVETCCGKSAVSLLVTKGHWRWREGRVRDREKQQEKLLQSSR